MHKQSISYNTAKVIRFPQLFLNANQSETKKFKTFEGQKSQPKRHLKMLNYNTSYLKKKRKTSKMHFSVKKFFS